MCRGTGALATVPLQFLRDLPLIELLIRSVFERGTTARHAFGS